MKEYTFTELGFFTESACKRIAEAMNGTTFMNFVVNYSKCAGNCTLIVKTDYDGTEQEIKNFFISAALNHIR